MAFLLCWSHKIIINYSKVSLLYVDRYENIMVLHYRLNIEYFNDRVRTMNLMISSRREKLHIRGWDMIRNARWEYIFSICINKLINCCSNPVARNYIINRDVISQNRIFWIIGEQTYIVYYPIISYQKIKVYRVETMDTGRSQWNNVVSGKVLLSISTMVFVVWDRYFGRTHTMIHLYVDSYVE